MCRDCPSKNNGPFGGVKRFSLSSLTVYHMLSDGIRSGRFSSVAFRPGWLGRPDDGTRWPKQCRCIHQRLRLTDGGAAASCVPLQPELRSTAAGQGAERCPLCMQTDQRAPDRSRACPVPAKQQFIPTLCNYFMADIIESPDAEIQKGLQRILYFILKSFLDILNQSGDNHSGGAGRIVARRHQGLPHCRRAVDRASHRTTQNKG